jgi:hypothetical protein
MARIIWNLVVDVEGATNSYVKARSDSAGMSAGLDWSLMEAVMLPWQRVSPWSEYLAPGC